MSEESKHDQNFTFDKKQKEAETPANSSLCISESDYSGEEDSFGSSASVNAIQNEVVSDKSNIDHFIQQTNSSI